MSDSGFETGLGDWTAIDGTLSLVSSAHYGSQAAQLSGAGAFDTEMFALIPVAAGQPYELSAWVSADPQLIDKVRLRIRWLGSSGGNLGLHETSWDPWAPNAYQRFSTGVRLAPSGAAAARISVLVAAFVAPFSVLVDDISLDGPRPAAPTPTTRPTDPPTAPSATATPPISPSLTPTAPLTAPPRTATPKPAPPAPSATPTPTPTPSATPAPPPPPTPTPGPTPGAPVVFSQLTNGGFEDDGADGAPFGWRKIGGAVESVSSPARTGSRALALTSMTSATKWAYQTVQVDGGRFYEASAFARYTDPDVKAVFLRVSWYASADGGGQSLSSADSGTVLNTAEPAFRALTTGPIPAPADARSARVRLMLRPVSGALATAYFDDVGFAQTSAPPETSTPPATATAAPPPGATAAPEPDTPTPGPPAEPQLFQVLTNGSFEDVREDGTPYAWRKAGGEIAATDTAHVDGDLALEFVSRTSSTKWVYQVVTVEALRAYEFAGFAATAAGKPQAFLRVSWYASVDGSGTMIASADSLPTSPGMAAFQYLTTGAVQAPPDARSARLRLLLRPASAATAVAYFDALSFGETAVIPGAFASAALPSPTEDSEAGDNPLVVGLAAATPQIVNVTAEPQAPAAIDTDQGNRTLLFFLGSLAVPLLGLAVIGGIELSRRRETTGR